MDPVQAALYAVALPALAAAVVLFAVRALNKQHADATGAGPAIAAGLVVGFLGNAGLPGFPPKEAWKWLPYIAMAGAVAGAIEMRVPTPPRWLLRVLLFVVATFVSSPAADRVSLASLGIAAAGLAGLWATGRLERLGGTRAALLPSFIAAFGLALALAVFSGSIVLGSVCGALATAIATCLVLGHRLPVHARDAAVPATLIVTSGALCGFHWAELPVWSALAVAATPVGALFATRLLAQQGTPIRDVLRAAGGAAILSGFAVALAAMKSPAW